MVITSQHDRYYNFHSSSCIQTTTLQIIQFPLLLLHPKHYITDNTISTPPPASKTLHYRQYNFHSSSCIQNTTLHILQFPLLLHTKHYITDITISTHSSASKTTYYDKDQQNGRALFSFPIISIFWLCTFAHQVF